MGHGTVTAITADMHGPSTWAISPHPTFQSIQQWSDFYYKPFRIAKDWSDSWASFNHIRRLQPAVNHTVSEN